MVKLIEGVNDLVTTHPELVKEWNYEKNYEEFGLIPSKITKGFDRLNGKRVKIYWRCSKCGFEYQSAVYNRVQGKGNCPQCYANNRSKIASSWKREKSALGRECKEKEQSLGYLYPHIALEIADDIDSFTLYPNMNKKINWKCKNGHIYQASPNARINMKSGCPYCDGRKVQIGKTDLATLYPDLLKEWDYEKNDEEPTKINPRSAKYAYWLCENKHSYKTEIRNKVSGTRCPYCINKKVLKGYNDLATIYPEVALYLSDKNNIKADEIVYGSGKLLIWVCKECGKEFEQRLDSRVKCAGKCLRCTGSYTENLVSDYLEKLNIPFEREVKVNNGTNFLFFDFYVDNKIVIEIDGVQHFKNTNFGTSTLKTRRFLDTQKNSLCLEKNIPLLRVPGLDIAYKYKGNKEFEQGLLDTIKQFIDTNIVPEFILEFYKNNHTNYYNAATKMNEIISGGNKNG